jgi:hypothetical protein
VAVGVGVCRCRCVSLGKRFKTARAASAVFERAVSIGVQLSSYMTGQCSWQK